MNFGVAAAGHNQAARFFSFSLRDVSAGTGGWRQIAAADEAIRGGRLLQFQILSK
jgi:hypothetical protein